MARNLGAPFLEIEVEMKARIKFMRPSLFGARGMRRPSAPAFGQRTQHDFFVRFSAPKSVGIALADSTAVFSCGRLFVRSLFHPKNSACDKRPDGQSNMNGFWRNVCVRRKAITFRHGSSFSYRSIIVRCGRASIEISPNDFTRTL